MTTATYSITMTDNNTAPAWLNLCSSQTDVRQIPGTQTLPDRCRMTVTTEQPEALEAALDADDDVIEYETADGGATATEIATNRRRAYNDTARAMQAGGVTTKTATRIETLTAEADALSRKEHAVSTNEGTYGSAEAVRARGTSEGRWCDWTIYETVSGARRTAGNPDGAPGRARAIGRAGLDADRARLADLRRKIAGAR